MLYTPNPKTQKLKRKKLIKHMRIEFARHCMLQLVQKKETPESVGEIHSRDLYKVESILSQYK